MKVTFSVLILSVLLISCKGDNCKCEAPPLESTITGRWEWVKTTSPSGTTTPVTAGFSREMNYFNANSADYVTFHENDSLKKTLTVDRSFIKYDADNKSFLQKFRDGSYIKFFIRPEKENGHFLLEISQPMSQYNSEADTVRHRYRYAGEANRVILANF